MAKGKVSYFLISVLVVSSSFFATLIFWVALFFWLFDEVPLVSNYLNSKFVFVSSGSADQYYYEIGKLASNGIILDLKDVWAFQGDFYSAVIGVLIAIIGVFGVLAFMYIKASSNEKIEEAARETAGKAISETLLSVEFTSAIEDSTEDIRKYIEKHMEDSNGYEGLKLRVKLIEEHIANLDQEENDGANLTLGDGR